MLFSSSWEIFLNVKKLFWLSLKYRNSILKDYKVSDATTCTIGTRAGRSIQNPHGLCVHTCVCKVVVTIPPDPNPKFRISLLTWDGNPLFQAHHHNNYHNLHWSSQGRANKGSPEYSMSAALTLRKINNFLPPKMCNSNSNREATTGNLRQMGTEGIWSHSKTITDEQWCCASSAGIAPWTSQCVDFPAMLRATYLAQQSD